MTTEYARKLHFSSIVVDTHSDSIGRVVDGGEDLGLESIFLQVYLSSACKSRSATLTLHAFDSHAFPRTPLVFRVVFPAADIGDATLLTRV